jgi:serine/threonine-protein kinase
VGIAAVVVVLASCEAGYTVPMAGSGAGGNSGDGGPATGATLNAPDQVAVAPDGSFYVADHAECVIRRVDASTQQISTIAGNGTCGDDGDDASAIDAQLRPSGQTGGMAVGPDGSLWFIQEDYVTVAPGRSVPLDWHLRRILPDGTMTTPNLAQQHVTGVDFAADGTMYYSDGTPYVTTSSVYEVPPGGSSTAVYSSSILQLGPVAVSGPDQLTIGAAPMSQYSEGTVKRLDLASGTLTQLYSVGSGFVRSVTASSTGAVYAIAMDMGFGSVNHLHEVVRIDPDGTTSVIAGNGTADPGTTAQWGPATSLSLTPSAVVTTPHNGLLVTSGHVVYRIADPGNV